MLNFEEEEGEKRAAMLEAPKEQRLRRASLISEIYTEGNTYAQLARKPRFSTVSAISLAESRKSVEVKNGGEGAGGGGSDDDDEKKKDPGCGGGTDLFWLEMVLDFSSGHREGVKSVAKCGQHSELLNYKNDFQ